MQTGPFTIIAPALNAPANSEAEIFGCATWLWMHADAYRSMPLYALSTLLLPAIKSQQFIIASTQENGINKPVAYLQWANLDAEAECRYLRDPSAPIPEKDWSSGDRMWILSWFAPFGHARSFRTAIKKLLANSCARTLYHRGDERGMRILTVNGEKVSKTQAEQWWQDHPIMMDLSRTNEQ